MTIARWSLAIGSLLVFGCGSAPSAPVAKMPPSVDVTGRWMGTYVTNVGTMPVELVLKQDDANVTGTASVAGDSWTTSTYRGDLSRECLFIHVPWRRRRGDRHRGGDMRG